MKNFKPEWRVSCLRFDPEILSKILGEIYGVKCVYAHLDLDGVWFSSDVDPDWGPNDEEVCEKLSEYFDVHITSFHIDDSYCPDVWLCYIQDYSEGL